jgi:hypothetical protein
MKKTKKIFGDYSIRTSPFQYAEIIAELASRMIDTDGWHSCDFMFYKKDGKLFLLDEFRIRNASKKILKKLLNNKETK